MPSIVPQLNPEQKHAAEAPISPLLIVAGAGTGKTRTLTTRIVHLIGCGIPPDKICAITFTNKAAQEMKERVARMHAGGKPGPYIGTFHALGARILRQECRVFGREPNFVIFDDHDSFDLVKKAVKAISPKDGADEKKRKEAPTLFAKKISEIKNLDGVPADPKVKIVFDAYEAALQRNNAFDFDDLIEKPVALFRKHPEILKKYQNRFDAILVDEYQDINPKQYDLIRLLAGGHGNLTVVGDDEQTIYTWRHADIRIFLGFEKDWPKAAVHFLEENYRSTGNIIRAASAVVHNNKFRTPKQLWTKQEDGGPITLYEAWGENDEAAWIARQLMELRSAPAFGAGASIAILYRTNAQSRAIEQALIRENIPYKIFGGLKFYERREVKDAVAALRYAANGKDELSRERLEKNLSKRKFAEFRGALIALANPKPADVIKAFLEVFGYFDYLENNFINADERQENIAELTAFASGFEDLPELLERLSLLQATDDENAETGERGAEAKNAVHLSTIHMAKGLEFDAVFIAGAAEGLLPHIRSIESDESLEEERRLMYVAMTRARKSLSISFYGLPSRFIAEIPEDCLRLVEADEKSVRY
ncbi:MAG TPA: UvrD-helicase domain-containing protein [Candidatus Paceibacterota bacterium]|nr:UvrD-helicase domain-containing protein [Candidatus Paceibacterota bacterium]